MVMVMAHLEWAMLVELAVVVRASTEGYQMEAALRTVVAVQVAMQVAMKVAMQVAQMEMAEAALGEAAGRLCVEDAKYSLRSLLRPRPRPRLRPF